MSIDLNDIDKAIEEGLAEIDKETQDDEEIRSRAQMLVEKLKKYKSIRTVGWNNDEAWQIGHVVYDYIDPTTGEKRSLVRLICANEARMKIGGLAYQPMVIDADIDEDYDYEQALEAAITAFVAKQFGKFIVEQLEE